MGVKVRVSPHQQGHIAGSAVEGVVEVEVSTKNNKGSSADKLKLRMVGRIKTAAVCTPRRDDDTVKKVARQEIEHLSHDEQLASFGGKAASGTHSFPFSVMLPADVPPTMEEHDGMGGCSIEYTIEAHLQRPGLLNFDAKGSSIVTVLGTPRSAGDAVPVTVEPSTHPVKYCCLFNRGSMSIGFRMDRSWVGLNEPIGLNIVARNDSSTAVKGMNIENKQVTRWSADGHRDSKARTVASMVVPGAQLGALQWAAQTGNERGQVTVAVTESAQQDLKQQLDAGAGTRYELIVPSKSLLTLQTTTLRVSHTLSIELDTSTCLEVPSVWTPLSVVQATVGAGVQPRAPSLVPPQALPDIPLQAVPYGYGQYGSAQTVPYPNPQGMAVPYLNPQEGGVPYPYPHGGAMPYSDPLRGSPAVYPYPQDMTYVGYEPGIAPVMSYATPQAVPSYSSTQMDTCRSAMPGVVPQGGG